MSTITVGYWKIRGLVEPIHMYLAYKDVPYEVTAYTYENAAKWTEDDKKNLGIEFPNIPYIIDGDVKLSQSNSILKYLEKKFGSYCNGDLAHDIKLDVLLESISDIRLPFTLMCYMEGDMAKKKEMYLSPRNTSKFEYFDGWLKDRKFLTGDSLCVADFALWNIVDYNDSFDANILASYKNIQRFKKDFQSDPKVDAYLKDPNYKKFPINGAIAQWGGKDQPE